MWPQAVNGELALGNPGPSRCGADRRTRKKKVRVTL
jgi:hypothetical protein